MNYKFLGGTLLATTLLLGACGDTDSEKLGTSDGKIEKEEKVETKQEEKETTEVKTEEEALTDIKVKEVNINKDLGDITYTIHKIGKAKVNSDRAIENGIDLFENYNEGEKANIIYAEITLENKTETPYEFYIDQAQIITDSGEQLDSAMSYLDGQINAEMKGKVKSKGTIYWELKNTDVNDVKSFKLVAPALNDADFNEIKPEEQIELAF